MYLYVQIISVLSLVMDTLLQECTLNRLVQERIVKFVVICRLA